MSVLRVLADRLRALRHRDAVLRDIDEELRAHIELEVDDRVRRGMSPAEARRAALRAFGSLPAARDRGYDVRGGGLVEQLVSDLRFALRVLRRSRAVTLSVLLTWALGIGASVAVFSVVKPLLLDPLPFPEPERLFTVYERSLPKFSRFSVASGNFASWQVHGGPWSELVATSDRNVVLLGSGEPARLRARAVTDGYFRVFGLQPALGRDFLVEEQDPDHAPVAILSHGLWQQRFGGDPAVLGKTLALDGKSTTVVGVMPAGLHATAMGENPASRVALWVPAALDARARANHGGHSFRVVGRLAPGATLDQARASLAASERLLAVQFPSAVQGWEAMADPLAEGVAGELRPSLLLLAVAVAFVLLIACANVASLLLGRAAVREREIAVRAALGAGRGRIVRQLATESLVLSVAGGLLGMLLGVWGVNLLLGLGAQSLAGLGPLELNLPLLAFTLGASVIAGLIVGVVPALHASRGDLQAPLKAGGRTATGGLGRARARRTLVVVEVAACMLLVVGAGLLLRSLGRLVAVDPGFRSDGVGVVQLDLPRGKYQEDGPRIAFVHRALEEIAALPGVRAVAVSQQVPLFSDMIFTFTVVGQPALSPEATPSANFYGVTPDYHRALGVPLLAGRLFNAGDVNGGNDVLLVNERLARQFFPDGKTIGGRLSFDEGKSSSEIVGVVADVKQYGLAADAPYQVYSPYDQSAFPSLSLLIKADGDVTALAPSIRARVAAIDPDQPVGTMRRLDEVVSSSLARQRFAGVLLSVFAGVALLMAMIGIYGVISDAVTQRTHEIGVRMALGARRGEVLALMMRQGLAPAILGVALGLGGALAGTRLLASLLYGVGATDAVTLGGAAALLLGVAVVASYLPARRATGVDPMIALRAD